MVQKILIYDSELDEIEQLNCILSEYGFRIEANDNLADVKNNLDRDNIDLFFICLHRKSEGTHNFLKDFKSNGTGIPYVFAMDYDDNLMVLAHYDDAVCYHDMRYSDFESTVETIMRTLHHIHMSYDVHERISTAYDKVKNKIPVIVRSNSPVLVVGDNGTGKSYFAQDLHNRIYNDHKICISWCADTCSEENFEAELFGSIYMTNNGQRRHHRGLLEQAEGSVMYISGITKLSPRNHKILRNLIKSKHYRMVGDTANIPLKCTLVFGAEPEIDHQILEGTFDKGFYNLISPNRVDLPSLREATEDIKPMAKFFLSEHCRQQNVNVPKISEAAIRYLENQPWFDNLRELKNCIEKAADHHTGNQISKVDIIAVSAKPKYRRAQPDDKKIMIEALKFCNGNVTVACERAGMTRSTFNRNLVSFGIDPNDYRSKRYNCGKKKKQSS